MHKVAQLAICDFKSIQSDNWVTSEVKSEACDDFVIELCVGAKFEYLVFRLCQLQDTRLFALCSLNRSHSLLQLRNQLG